MANGSGSNGGHVATMRKDIRPCFCRSHQFRAIRRRLSDDECLKGLHVYSIQHVCIIYTYILFLHVWFMANGHGFHIGLPYNDHDTWSVLQNEALSMLCPGQTTVFSALRWVEQNVERKKWRKVESASNDKNGGRLGLPLKLGQIYHGWGRIFWDNPGVDTPPTPWSKPVDQTWQWLVWAAFPTC